MDNCKSVSNPLAEYFKLSVKSCPKSKEEMETMPHISYSSAVRSLMYAMVCARPNSSYVVNVVAALCIFLVGILSLIHISEPTRPY